MALELFQRLSNATTANEDVDVVLTAGSEHAAEE
jgi:hypothetical protein